MACCITLAAEDREAIRRHSLIEKQLQIDKKDSSKEFKLLLLGAGGSGKSTILKQMKIIHHQGFSPSELEEFRFIILENIYSIVQSVARSMVSFGIAYELQENETFANSFLIDNDRQPIGPDLVKHLQRLWKDKGIEKCVERGNEFNLIDSAHYFMNDLERCTAKDFQPNEQDILRARKQTTGITETKFLISGYTYNLIDVGGQRSERRKWIHCFENVTAVLFLVGVSEYDQMLLEDASMNRFNEALSLFSTMIHSKWFLKTSMIIFLNKIDILKEKLKVRPLQDFFPEYTGGSNIDTAIAFMDQLFRDIALHPPVGVTPGDGPPKKIYIHPTCAVDTDHMRAVLKSVRDIIIRKALQSAGVL